MLRTLADIEEYTRQIVPFGAVHVYENMGIFAGSPQPAIGSVLVVLSRSDKTPYEYRDFTDMLLRTVETSLRDNAPFSVMIQVVNMSVLRRHLAYCSVKPFKYEL